MGYTLSFDASEKCGRADVMGLMHHIGRDVDRENGQEVTHANKDIDPARTEYNETWVSDGNGGHMACYSTKDIENALCDRLLAVKKPLRKDAVVLRPLILQLDPEWYDSHPDEDERVDAANDMVDWAMDTFGRENIIYAALHLDERNPHIHIGFCPVTPDGRLSQKDWFRNPGTLREMHNDFRQWMTDKGYDIQMERKKPGKHARRMSIDEYKDFVELEKQRKAQDAHEAALEAQEAILAGQAIEIQKTLQEARETLQKANKELQKAQTFGLDRKARWEAYQMRMEQQQLDNRIAQAEEAVAGIDMKTGISTDFQKN